MSKKKIIYILGAGRSGTTLLEILLGNVSTIFSCGELNRYPKRRGIPPQRDIASPPYQFWQHVKAQLPSSEEDIIQLEALHYQYEYHSGLIRNLLGLQNRKPHIQYSTFIRRLYNAIFNTIPETIITDSSKYPGRALELAKLLSDEYELLFIYIKRNPINVVRSFAKKDIEQPSKNWLSANIYYFFVNLLCQYVLHKLEKQHKTVQVTYEELVNHPRAMLTTIQQAFQIDLTDVMTKLEQGQALDTGYLFDGNRIRLKESIRLTPSDSAVPYSLADKMTQFINYPLYR